ncbi:unnamed protein product, partial [marine sediment metagenome]
YDNSTQYWYDLEEKWLVSHIAVFFAGSGTPSGFESGLRWWSSNSYMTLDEHDRVIDI